MATNALDALHKAQVLDDRDVLFTRREAALYLRRTVRTLELWAQQGIGPRFSVVNGRALYSLRELRAVAGTCEAPEQ